MDSVEEDANMGLSDSPMHDTALQASFLVCQQLRTVWDEVQSSWATLLAAEATAHYDSLQREELSTADEYFAQEFPAAALSCIEALASSCIEKLMDLQPNAAASSDSLFRALEEHTQQTVQELNNTVPYSLRRPAEEVEAVWLSAKMLTDAAQRTPVLALAAHLWLKMAFHMYNLGSCFTEECATAPLASVLCTLQLPSTVPIRVANEWGSLAREALHVVPDSLFVAQVCQAQSLTEWAHVDWNQPDGSLDSLADPSRAVQALEDMAATARDHSSVFLEVSFRLRMFNWHCGPAAAELGSLQEDRAMGLTSSAEGLCKALFLACDFAQDPLRVCGGDVDMLASLQQKHSFDPYDQLQQVSSAGVDLLLQQLHDTEDRVLKAVQDAIPEALTRQPSSVASEDLQEVDEFLCGQRDLEDWGGLLSAACQLALNNQQELVGRELPKGSFAETALAACQEAVEHAARALQAYAPWCTHVEFRDRYAECASQLSALQSGLRLQYSALLKADGKHHEVAVYMETELMGLLSGSDSVAKLQLQAGAEQSACGSSSSQQGDAQTQRLHRKYHLLRARQSVLFALRCSTAWATLGKWADAERVILHTTEFLGEMQAEFGTSDESELTVDDLQREFQILPLEVAILRSMAWTQLARAVRAQGEEERYLQLVHKNVLGALGPPLLQHGAVLLENASDWVEFLRTSAQGVEKVQTSRANALACAVYHTGQQALFSAIDELIRPKAGLETAEALFEAYSNLEEHTPTIRQWSALASTLAEHSDTLTSMSGQVSKHDSGGIAAAASPVFIWTLPSSASEIMDRAAQVEYWSGKLMHQSSYLQAQSSVVEAGPLTECRFPLRQGVLSHSLSTAQSPNLEVALWHFRQALEQAGLSPDTDASSGTSTEKPPLWCFECACLLVQESVRSAAVAVEAEAGATTVQQQVDWKMVGTLCERILQFVDTEILDANPRLQLAVAGLQRHQVLALANNTSLDAAAEYGAAAAERSDAMMKASMRMLHELEDDGVEEAALAKTGRCVLLLQQMAVAQLCDLAHIHAILHTAASSDGTSLPGNKVGQCFSSALKCAEEASRYRGVETAYPAAVLCGFPLLTWTPQLQVLKSHVQVLLQLVFDAIFSCVSTMLDGDIWTNDTAAQSLHSVLRGQSEHLFSLEGAVDDICSFAYTSGPAADLALGRSRRASLQTRSNAHSCLMCAGLLHKLAVWLEAQQSYAPTSPAARPAYFNALFVAGNIFRMVGNEAGEQRSRTKAAEALRQAIDYYSVRSDTADLLSDDDRVFLTRRAREALTSCLDELGACLYDAQLFVAALETFVECRDVRVVLYTSTAGDSAFSAKFNNSQYVWVTLAGIVESALRCDRPSIAVDIAQEQLTLLDAAASNCPCFWHLIPSFAAGRALLRQGYLLDGYAKLKRTAALCETLLETRNTPTCEYTCNGAHIGDQLEVVLWGSPRALYAGYQPHGLSPARVTLDMRLRCLWQMAEAARTMFKLQVAVADFNHWLSVCNQEQEAWADDQVGTAWVQEPFQESFDAQATELAVQFARDVEKADVLHGLAAVQMQLGLVDAAMESLQDSRAQRLQTEGMLSRQYTSCVVDIARHFMRYASDPGAAIGFLQHPLGLLSACLQECRRRQGHARSDSAGEISESDDSDTDADSDSDEPDTLNKGLFAPGSALLGSAAVGAPLGTLAEAAEEDESSSSDEDDSGGKTARPARKTRGGRSKTAPGKSSEQLQRAQLTRVSGAACLAYISSCSAFQGIDNLDVLSGLIPAEPEDVDASEAVDWQLQLGGTVDDMALDLLTMQLQRQVAAILYHIGLALALQSDLPHPPQPLDTFNDVSVCPRVELLAHFQPVAETNEGTDASDSFTPGESSGRAADRKQAACALVVWYRALQLELQVRSASTEGEFTPSMVALKSLTRIGQLMHCAFGETDAAIQVLSFGCRWLLHFDALATVAERNVAPVLWICLSACKAHAGDFHGSAAAGGLCIDGLHDAKESIDERDGVDLMSAMQCMSLMAQYECLALSFQARVYLEQDMPDTALACLRAADRTLAQYTSPSSPHTARILYWDARIVAIKNALADLYESVGDSVKAKQYQAAAQALQGEREAESNAVTAAVAAAAREGLW